MHTRDPFFMSHNFGLHSPWHNGWLFERAVGQVLYLVKSNGMEEGKKLRYEIIVFRQWFIKGPTQNNQLNLNLEITGEPYESPDSEANQGIPDACLSDTTTSYNHSKWRPRFHGVVINFRIFYDLPGGPLLLDLD